MSQIAEELTSNDDQVCIVAQAILSLNTGNSLAGTRLINDQTFDIALRSTKDEFHSSLQANMARINAGLIEINPRKIEEESGHYLVCESNTGPCIKKSVCTTISERIKAMVFLGPVGS